MRLVFVFIAYLGIISIVYSQETDLSKQVHALKIEINSSQGSKRLQWLDSLSTILEFNAALQYDSIASSTVNRAITLESYDIAAKHIANLIYFYEYYEQDYEKAHDYFESYIPYFSKMKPDKAAEIYLNIGNAAKYAQKNEAAIELLEKAYNKATQANSKRSKGLAKLYQAQIFATTGDYPKAFTMSTKAEEMLSKVQDTSNIISVKILQSVLYAQQYLFEEAETIRNEAIPLAIKTKNYSDLVLLYNNQSSDASHLNQPEKRLKYARLAYETNKKNKNGRYLEVAMLTGLITKYADVDSLEMAKKYLDKMLAKHTLDSMNFADRLHAEEAIGYYAFKTGDYNKALTLWLKNRKQLGKQMNLEGRMNSEKTISDIYEKLNQPENQIKHLNNYIALSDSLNTEKNRRTLSYYQTKYETEKRDNTIAAQQMDLEILAQKNTVKNQWIVFGSIGLVGLFSVILLYRSRNNLKNQQNIQENFSKELMLAQEKERNRLARELHDGLGQQLTLIKKKAQNLDQQELATMTSNTLDEVRSISRALYPPMLKKLGLSKSISQTLFELDEETEVLISSEVDPDIDMAFNEEDTLNFYRFIQEAVTNAIKHSKANTLIVKISKEKEKINALISDNGIGFNNIQAVSQESLGLKTMTERIKALGGKLLIRSQEGKGTWLIAEINK